MKILIDINHPAHVHFFKNLIWAFENRGFTIFITARGKEITTDLLERYGFQFEVVSTIGKGILGLTRELLVHQRAVYRILKMNEIDLVLSIGGTFNVHACKLLHIPSLVFTDTEHAKFQNSITFPFATKIVTPSCYRDKIGRKQVRYNGYHELAYLHPNYFKPNPAVLDEIGLDKDDTFIIMRFVSWDASHDIGQHGIQDRTALVRELEKYGQVFITSEGRLDGGLAKYQIKVSPEKMHDLLYYATLLYGESSTMASECAVLGTHAIFCDFAGRGYTDEEEERYGLVYNFKLDEDSIRSSLEKAVDLLEDNDLKNLGQNKREKLLEDKIDATAFMIWFIETYPDSFGEMRESKGGV